MKHRCKAFVPFMFGFMVFVVFESKIGRNYAVTEYGTSRFVVKRILLSPKAFKAASIFFACTATVFVCIHFSLYHNEFY